MREQHSAPSGTALTSLSEAPSLTGALALSRGQLLDVLLDVEEALRDSVQTRLKRRGRDWRRLIPEKIRTRLEQAQRREHADIYSPIKRRRLLEFTTIGDLQSIVAARWEIFEPLFQRKQAILERIERFRVWRNALAHPTTVSDEQKIEIAFAAIDLARHLLPPETEPSLAELEATEPDTPQPLEEKRILWVDDRPSSTRSERRSLEDLGAEIFPVLTNVEAVAEATSGRFDLVVSDIARPNDPKSGLDLPGVLARRGLALPLVYFVGVVNVGEPVPEGAIAITNSSDDLFAIIIDELRNS